LPVNTKHANNTSGNCSLDTNIEANCNQSRKLNDLGNLCLAACQLTSICYTRKLQKDNAYFDELKKVTDYYVAYLKKVHPELLASSIKLHLLYHIADDIKYFGAL
jgi:hypothetical protein